MTNWYSVAARAGALALAAATLAPAAARADVFAWRTEDGVFAYTDDRDKIPSRYAEEAVAVRDTRLRDYPRLTKEDTALTRAVADRMQKRLDYLRQMNSPDATARSANPAAARSTLEVATGQAMAPTFHVSGSESDGPLVVEPILSHDSNESRTRRSILVKQGGRTLAVVKGQPHHHNVNEDIYDEDELEAGR